MRCPAPPWEPEEEGVCGMLNVAIVDDEAAERQKLRKCLDEVARQN